MISSVLREQRRRERPRRFRIVSLPSRSSAAAARNAGKIPGGKRKCVSPSSSSSHHTLSVGLWLGRSTRLLRMSGFYGRWLKRWPQIRPCGRVTAASCCGILEDGWRIQITDLFFSYLWKMVKYNQNIGNPVPWTGQSVKRKPSDCQTCGDEIETRSGPVRSGRTSASLPTWTFFLWI